MEAFWIGVLTFGAFQSDDVPEKTIPKAERSTYLPVLEKYKAAEAVLPTDPLDCVRRCKELIEDKSLNDAYREKRLRLQNTDGSYAEWTLFLPFQLRGRALLARAEALAPRDRVQATDLAKEARGHFEESEHRGVKSSAALLEKARKLVLKLSEVRPEPDPRQLEAEARMEEIRKLKAKPEEILRRCSESASLLDGAGHRSELRLIRQNALEEGWTAHARQGRFRSAAEFLKAHGAFLTKEEGGKAEAEIGSRCREHVAKAVTQFRIGLRETLPPGRAWETLRALSKEEFEGRFALPGEAELVTEEAALKECRHTRERLAEVRAAADPPALPLAEFLKLVSGVARPETAPLATDLSRMRLEKAVQGADELPAAELQSRREEVRKVAAELKDLSGPERLELEGFAARLPEDPPALAEIGRALLDPANPDGLWGTSPALAGELEKKLAALASARLSRESRRKAGTYLAVAVAGRLLLSGKSEDDVLKAAELREARRLLRSDGPHPEVLDRISPRIRAVAEQLR